MPATETTWRNTLQLHRIFAVTGVLLVISNLWMFWADHARSWKTYQVDVTNIDLKINDLRQKQYETGDALVEHDQRARELTIAKAEPVDDALLDRFKSLGTQLDKVLEEWKNAGHAYTTVSIDVTKIDRQAARLKELSATAKEKRTDADAAAKAVDEALSELQKKPDDPKRRDELTKRESEFRRADA